MLLRTSQAGAGSLNGIKHLRHYVHASKILQQTTQYKNVNSRTQQRTILGIILTFSSIKLENFRFYTNTHGGCCASCTLQCEHKLFRDKIRKLTCIKQCCGCQEKWQPEMNHVPNVFNTTEYKFSRCLIGLM